jgi:hypothetical protein
MSPRRLTNETTGKATSCDQYYWLV